MERQKFAHGSSVPFQLLVHRDSLIANSFSGEEPVLTFVPQLKPSLGRFVLEHTATRPDLAMSYPMWFPVVKPVEDSFYSKQLPFKSRV